MTARPTPFEPGQIPDDLVDAFFDGELDEGKREKLFGAMRADLNRCAEVATMQRIISLLREPVEAPDLTEPIMERLRVRGAFLPSRTRRFIKYGRWAAALLLASGVLGVALVHRSAPDSLRLVAPPKPVTGVIRSGSSDVAAGVQQLTQAMNVVSARVLEPAEAQQQSRRAQRMISIGLTPGNTSVRLPGEGGGAIVVYTGSGTERFVVPDGIYFDRSSAMVLPLGHIAPSRSGQDWTAISPENPFLLPSLKEAPADPQEPNVRIVK